jgi:hypothetical protein
MKFPNLLWAIEESRLAHYELASRIGMDASRFSRCLRGRFEFAPHERTRIAEVLAYPVEWLFAEARPPRTVASPEPRLAVAEV